MKNIRDFLSQNFQFLEVKFSTCLNRHVFVMKSCFFLLLKLNVVSNHQIIKSCDVN